MELAVSVEGIAKSFGDVDAVRDVSFAAERGSVLALLGPNGAGKTTTVRVLSTLVVPDRGHASVAGHDVAADPELVRQAIGLTGQFAAIDDELTGEENLVLFARLRGWRRGAANDRARDLLGAFDLEDAAAQRAKTYSGGMRRRLDLAMSLVVEPEVLVLDEPTTGLDPRSRFALWDEVRGLRDRGVTVLLTTQYLEEADQLADRIVVIDRGLVAAEGTASELKARVGGAAVEVVATDPEQLQQVADLMTAQGLHPSVHVARASVTASADGWDALSRVGHAVESAGIEVDDIGLRRPSLDEVFLALTGHRSDADDGAAADDEVVL